MKIIILDDSLTVRMIIESFLENLGVESHELFSFENGYEALDHIKQHGADMVFSDINMPYMNGYEFAEILFQMHEQLKSVFFAISGEEGNDGFVKMKNNGVRRFLKKPIQVEHFNHFVRPEILKLRLAEYS